MSRRAPKTVAGLQALVRKTVEGLQKRQLDPEEYCVIEWCSPSGVSNAPSVAEFLDLDPQEAAPGGYRFEFWEDGREGEEPSHVEEAVKHEVVQPDTKPGGGSPFQDFARGQSIALNSQGAEIRRLQDRCAQEEQRANRNRGEVIQLEDELRAALARIGELELELEADDPEGLHEIASLLIQLFGGADQADRETVEAMKVVIETAKADAATRAALFAAGAGAALRQLGMGDA